MKNKQEKIIQLIFEKFGMDISVYDESFLWKSIWSRMDTNSCKDLDNYCRILDNDPVEASVFHDSLSNFYSEFFRNPLTFAILEQIVLPKIINEKGSKHNNEVRIWSAGCAAGQEPYSIAMLADHLKNSHAPEVSTFIFGTDCSLNQLELAGKGIYDFKAVQNTRLSLANSYFSIEGSSYIVKDSLKKQVDFSFYNLLDIESSAPASSIYGDFDLIVCSNLLFYYKPEVQKQILTKFTRSLRPGGFFITGEAEKAIIGSFSSFRQFSQVAPVFVYK